MQILSVMGNIYIYVTLKEITYILKTVDIPAPKP